MSAILFASHIAKEFQIDIDKLPNCSGNEDCFDEILQNKIMILKIDGVLFFGSASQIMSRIDEVMHEECVIIDCSSITSMDISAVFALEDLIMTLKDKKIRVILIFNNRILAARVLRSGLRKIIDRNSYTFSKKEAVEKAQKLIAIIEKK
ncbi:MAG: STAS domain-containing protein [Candidatus Gastranaerophilaceae bacterium]